MFERIVKILEYVITIILAVILVFVDKLPDFFPIITSGQLIGIEIILLIGLFSMIWLDIKEIRKQINIANDKSSGIIHGNLNQSLSEELRKYKKIDVLRVFASSSGTIQSIVSSALNCDSAKRIDKCYLLVHQIHGNSKSAITYNTRLFQILDSWYRLKQQGFINELYVKVFEELPDFLPVNYHVTINDAYMIYGLLGLHNDVTKVKVDEPSIIRNTTTSSAKFINKHVAWFDSFWNANNDIVNKTVYEWVSNDAIENILTMFQSKKNELEKPSKSKKKLEELFEISLHIQRIIIQQYNNMAEVYVLNRGMEEFQQKICDDFFENYVLPYKQSNCSNEKLKLLDVGSGSGRDLLYYNEKSQNNIELYSIELCKDLYYGLKSLVDMQIIDAEIRCQDMQDLSCYDDETFHIVQHKATLIHMPIIAPGYTAHKCLSESYRVLKQGGLLYLTVREAEKSQIVLKISGNGIGFRIFQMYSASDIKQLVETNGFDIISVRKLKQIRKNDDKEKEVDWVEIIAHKV